MSNRQFKPQGKRVSSAVRGRQLAALARAGAMVRARNRAVGNRLVSNSRGINSTSVFQGPGKAERKFCDTNVPCAISQNTTTEQFTAGVPGAPPLLNGIGPGTDATQHIGREINMTSLYWIWEGHLAVASTGGGPMRLVIVYDKESEGAAPTTTGGQTAVFTVDSIVAQNNLNNRDRFIVLVDEWVETVSAVGPSSFLRKGFRKMSLPVVYNATGNAAVASINTGAIYAFCWQDGGILGANGSMQLQTRIRFTDV